MKLELNLTSGLKMKIQTLLKLKLVKVLRVILFGFSTAYKKATLASDFSS